MLLAAAGAVLLLGRNDRFKSGPVLPQPPLKKLAARRGVQIGTYAARDFLPDRPYKEILTTQFEYLIIDGLPNWSYEDGDLRPSETEYDFSRIDEIMSLAQQHGMPIRMHHYVWGEKR